MVVVDDMVSIATTDDIVVGDVRSSWRVDDDHLVKGC